MSKRKFAAGVLGTDGLLRQEFYLNFHNHGNDRKLCISVISRHSVYITITSLSMEYMSQKIDFPYFSKEPVKSFVGMFRKMKISLYDN